MKSRVTRCWSIGRNLWLAMVILSTSASGQHEGHVAPPPEPGAPPASSTLPEGYAEVTLSAERQQLIGMKVARAERGVLKGTVRAAGLVTADETREAHVHSKVMGWVEKLFVNAVGQQVKKGDPLYSLYSQELYSTQQEFLRARSLSGELARAARSRLELWDVPEDQIRLIRKSGPRKAIVFRSPISGTVIEKQILQGHAVEPDMMLYRIADLTQVWVIAEAYEFEVGRVDTSGTAKVLVQGIPEQFSARVDYVYPTVDPATRTIKIRLVVPNPKGALRPGAFATVELPTVAAEALWVPEASIVDTGVRQVVYRALGDGRFRPVEVQVGRRMDGKAEILSGVEDGDQVVVSAQFLLDSESRLRGATGAEPQHGGH